MSSLNKCSFIGNLGKDPEIRVMQSGDSVASFSVACSEKWTDKATGEKKERTNWIPVVVFNKNLVKVVQDYIRKGDKIYVEGSFETRKWTDQNGNERYTTEIVLRPYNGTIIMLGSKNSDHQSSSHAPAQTVDAPETYDDEIPF